MWLPVVLWNFGWHRCTFQAALPKKENLALNYLELGAHFCAALKELGHNNRARAILAAMEKGGKWKKVLEIQISKIRTASHHMLSFKS